MEAVYASAVGMLAACGIYLVLRARTFTVVMGLTLLTYAVTLFLLGMGRLSTGKPPIIAEGASYADPLPQALVLTAIVIGFAMTAFVMVLALRSRAQQGSDHVDGAEPETGLSFSEPGGGDDSEPDGQSAEALPEEARRREAPLGASGNADGPAP
ncbi:Na+/H+ antiporter subunit C [Cupriavidus sp. AU9028]|nr:Na+/H+ antiporter subunit C [Cupriavidus sp. AU9028]